jgi:hypothetical protein
MDCPAMFVFFLFVISVFSLFQETCMCTRLGKIRVVAAPVEIPLPIEGPEAVFN